MLKFEVTNAFYPPNSRFIWTMIPQLNPERGVKVTHAASSIPQLVKELNDYQPERLMVYSSLLEQLAALQAIEGNLRIYLNWIIVGGEPGRICSPSFPETMGGQRSCCL
jgi:hypothetical protein